MLGDKEALMRQEKMHDERIMATGLRGYDRLQKQSGSSEESRNDANNDRRSAMKKEKSHSTGDLNTSTVSFDLPKVVTVHHEGATPPKDKLAWMRPARVARHSSGNTTKSISEVSESSSVSPSLRSRISGMSGMSKSDHPRAGRRMTDLDDGSSCSECYKKFKIGKRYKHHCSRCMATFCHKHGRTTHSNFTSCRVPGDCICNSCLNVLSDRSRHSNSGFSTD